MPKEVMDDVVDIGRDLVDADAVIVNKRKATLTRIYTYILAKLTATVSWVTTAQIAGNAVTRAKLEAGAGTSVVGNASGSSANVADITATVDDRLLGRSGGALGWIQATIGMFADGLLTRAKLASATGQSVIGRSASGTGAVADIAAGTDNRVLGQSGGVLSFLRATLAMLADGTALSVVGRAANTAGAYADIVAANDGEVMRRNGTVVGFGTVAAAGLATDAVTSAKILAANVTMAKLASWPCAQGSRATAQALTHNTGAALDLTASDYAYGGSDAPTVDLTNNRIVATIAGIYRITGFFSINAATSVAAGGCATAEIRLNGTTVGTPGAAALVLNAQVAITAHATIAMTAGQYVDLFCYQNSGVSQNMTTGSLGPKLTMEYVGPT